MRGDVWIANNTFTDNHAQMAGAVRVMQVCFPLFHNNTFARNSCEFHGGALLLDNVVDITNCFAQQNIHGQTFRTAISFRGQINGHKLADRVQRGDTTYKLISNATFIDNHAKLYGGALYMMNFVGRQAQLVNYHIVSLENITAVNNTAEEKDGGAIYIRTVGGTLSIRNSEFDGNRAPGGMGGAIAFGSTTDILNAVNLEGVTLKGGTAAFGGGVGGEGMLNLRLKASDLMENVATAMGGSIYCRDCGRVYIGYPGREGGGGSTLGVGWLGEGVGGW